MFRTWIRLGFDTSQNDAAFQEEKRSYKDCALDKDLKASAACRDIRDNYMKCKHEQVKCRTCPMSTSNVTCSLVGSNQVF